MPMQYEYTAIPESAVPRASNPVFQHLLDTYASETSKVVSVWREFAPADVAFKPADRSSSVLDIMKHQLLSERRFFCRIHWAYRRTGTICPVACGIHAGCILAPA
jgi:hypothetical protein